MFNSLLTTYRTICIQDENIYDRYKLYFEKYLCIKNTLKHNSNILQKMRFKNKILLMKNRQLEKEIQSLLNYDISSKIDYRDVDKDSYISSDDYEIIEA
jgi:hypothetical protein